MTNQEIFDMVVTHLRRQGCKAHNGMECLYRFGALACAVGCLIPDDKYEARFEGRSIREWWPLRECLMGLGISLEQFDLLVDLQTTHDCSDDWEEGFSNIARHYELEMPCSSS